MKKILAIALLILAVGCVYASDDLTVEINGVEFEIPQEYRGGEYLHNLYRLENEFSIRCIDDDIANAVGFSACKKDYSRDLNIKHHPARHFYHYNTYVNDNYSQLFFASGESIYEIAWTGNNITKEIKTLIKNTPKSKINDDAFYFALDESVDIYKQQRIEKLNRDSEHNYLEAKLNSRLNQENPDDKRVKEILLMQY